MDIKDEQYFINENARLREIIGSWRRKAQEKYSRRERECLKEGFNSYDNLHYKVYIVKDVPTDLPIREVLEELKKGFLLEVKPYFFLQCDYSTKYDSWLVKIGTVLPDVNMSSDDY